MKRKIGLILKGGGLAFVSFLSKCQFALADTGDSIDEISKLRLTITLVLAVVAVVVFLIDKVHQNKKW